MCSVTRLMLPLTLLRFVCFAQAEVRAVPKPKPATTSLVEFTPSTNENLLAPQFHLVRTQFQCGGHYDEVHGATIVTFASGKPSGNATNDNVYGEFYPANGNEPGPAAIVLHAIDGSLPPMRLICRELADQGVSSLLMALPCCGPRGRGTDRQIVSTNVHATVGNFVQAVADVRYAAAWLRAQPKIDANRIGVLGVSLGGIVGALTVSNEPRFDRAFLVLAGGNFGDLLWESQVASEVRRRWIEAGGTQASFLSLVSGIDPAMHAHRFPGCVLMINANDDEVIPRAAAESLWTAFGKQEIIWWPTGHATATLRAAEGLRRAKAFFSDRD